jgi:hypothetical protein
MTAPRDTGLRVTLPLVWRGDDLYCGPFKAGYCYFWPRSGTHYAHIMISPFTATYADQDHPSFPDRPSAERAVEEAVMKALGAEHG